MSRLPSSRLVLSVLAATLAGFAYLNALHNPFVYDDQSTIVGNPSLRHLGDLRALVLHSLFRPALNVSYALDHAVWGLRPFGYHLTSVLLHMLNVVLVFRVVALAVDDWRRREPEGGDRVSPDAAAFAAAALFAVHPLMTEAVAYVSGRSEVLAASFVMLALLALRAGIAHGRATWTAAGLVAVLLGLATKEVAAVLPLIVLAWDRLLLRTSREEARRRLVRLHVPLLAVAGSLAVARLAAFVLVEPPPATPFVGYLAAQPEAIGRYLGLIVLPIPQSVLHSVEPAVRGAAVVGDAALAGALVLAWRFRRRVPLVVLGATWFLAALAPSSLVPLVETMAEHRVYLASAGALLIVGVGWGRAWTWLAGGPLRWRVASAGGLAVALAALFLLTLDRNAVWGDPVALGRDAARKAPVSWRAHFGLGNALAEAGRCGEAVGAYEEAIRLAPQAQTFMNLGTCLAAQRRLPEAARAWEQALGIESGYVAAHYNLALLALGRGDREAAQRHFVRALTVDPRDDGWRQFLASVHAARMGDAGLTLDLCREIERVAPGRPGIAACLRKDGGR